MQRWIRISFAAFALALLALRSSHAAPEDSAARGIDVFVFASPIAPPGGSIDVLVEAFGFPTVASMIPLANAELEASWDPEHLGDGVTTAPPSVHATADAAGRAHVIVPVPAGPERELSLLVAARAHGHERVRAITLHRGPRERVAVHVVDPKVVPGSAVSAWVVVTRAETGVPEARAPIEVTLTEGGRARETVRATTDAAGSAAVRVHIPRISEPAWSWTLRATALTFGASGSVELSPREETPGAPRVTVAWDKSDYLAGDRARYRIAVRDAIDQPVAASLVRVWAGPKGTHPPKDDDGWDKIATKATNARGELEGEFDTPRTMVRGVGTSVDVVVHARVEGHELEAQATAPVGLPTSTAEVMLEAGHLVPGVVQRALLRVRDGKNEPIHARFHVDGDGLSADVATDDHGEGEIAWRAPADVGASRSIGPCAGGVAATMRIKPLDDVPALGRREPFDLCVPVDRDAAGIVVVEHAVARAGDRIHVSIPRGDGVRGSAWSLALTSEDGARASSIWMADADKGIDFVVPEGPPGVWRLSASSPSPDHPARVLAASIFVAPSALPRLVATSTGRPAPGGAVDVDADLSDGRGNPLTGTVAAVLVDLHGGASTSALERFDTRLGLCDKAGVDRDRCDAFLERDGALDPLRRALAGARPAQALAPLLDPGAGARNAMQKVFADVLKSLEGAVYESSSSAEKLRDVRRKGPNGFAWNPELLTLVTAAMDPAPVTPGGEPVVLGDLLAIDPQVTFDRVARRVTRLKLFRVLAAVRTFKRESGLELDEPIFRDPNAILRRLVREGSLESDLLLDPWGGTIQFTRATGPAVPFLSVVRGFELHAPGPDGAIGTADDVKDPFERVVRSGSPYANALHEDRVVDARLDAEVGDATVAAWQKMFDEFTGTALGLNGAMEGGGGRGEGIGLGGLGSMGHGSGHGRLGYGIGFGGAFWSPPTRTDARGHVRIHVPLGDAETTWRIALVAIPDTSTAAVATVDVATLLPLSVRLDAGASWVEGDQVDARVLVQNRTEQRARADLTIAASGVAELVDKPKVRIVDVPAHGATELAIRLRATSPGHAVVTAEIGQGGHSVDRLEQNFDVAAAGELTNLTQTEWIASHAEIATPIDRAMRLAGSPRLVLERGFESAIAEALTSLDPERLGSPDAMADAIEVAGRIKRWAIGREGDGSALAARADALALRAEGRLAAYASSGAPVGAATKARAAAWSVDKPKTRARAPSCPPLDATATEALRLLDAEPPPEAGAALACWDAFVASTVGRVERDNDVLATADALVALAERPQRATTAAVLADRLRELVALRPSGAIGLPEFAGRSRAARATVFAALLRAEALGQKKIASADRLAAWARVQEDATGGYGSAAATRAVVRALLASAPSDSGASEVTIDGDGASRTVKLAPMERIVVPLTASSTRVTLTVHGAPIVARLERPVVRLWSRPPDEALSPLKLDVVWPDNAHANGHGVLLLAMRHGFDHRMIVDARVPLPPGVTLAEPVDGVRQVQGALLVRRPVDATLLPTSIEVPIRFGLAERVTVPEATARGAFDELERTIAPARPFVVH